MSQQQYMQSGFVCLHMASGLHQMRTATTFTMYDCPVVCPIVSAKIDSSARRAIHYTYAAVEASNDRGRPFSSLQYFPEK